jgi:hypothetical protein
MILRSSHRSLATVTAGVGLAGAVLSIASGSLAQVPYAPAPAAARPATLQAPAQRTAPAASIPAAAASEYEVRGFRSAAFGMTQAQVRQAIGADFGPSARITESANPAEGTQILQITVPQLDPGPGPAQVTYIFGANSKTLASVNVVWLLSGEATADQRASVVAAGYQLANYFQTLPVPPKTVTPPAPTGPNGLLFFAAVDRRGAAVQVTADGVSYQATDKNNQPVNSPPPKGPAMLQLSYIGNLANPDIHKIKPGSF